MYDSDVEHASPVNNNTPYMKDSDAQSVFSDYEVNNNKIDQGSFGHVYK